MRTFFGLVISVLSAASVVSGAALLEDLPKLISGKARAAIHRDWSGEPLAPGECYEVSLRGPAVIKHIQVTIAPRNEETLRQTILEFYWDGEKDPSVRAPIADFFCDAFGGQSIAFSNLLTGNRSGAWHCYFPMPFRKSALIRFRNLSRRKLTTIAHEIDYRELSDLPPSTAYFHACFRRENPTREGVPYTILEARGRGHYIGLNLSMQSLADSFWFLEGNTEVFVDSEKSPSVENVGTEDYFNGGWYFEKDTYVGPYSGLTVKDSVTHRIAAYRFLIADPIPFNRSIKVLIHHGEGSKGPGSRADYASVAYWYQIEPHAPLPSLPRDPRELLCLDSTITPPAGYPLDPRKAEVSDARGTKFVWRANAGDDIPSDHTLYGGWEDPLRYRNYLAYGRAKIRGVWRKGVIVLAYPDGNKIRAAWPISAEKGKVLSLTASLTDAARRYSKTGAAVRISFAGGGKKPVLSLRLLPGESRVERKTFTLSGREKAIVVEIDNCGKEFWSVVYLDAAFSP